MSTLRIRISLVRYKMLESVGNGEPRDWIYRPDKKLKEEIERMRKCAAVHPPRPFEYRLNPAGFFLKCC